MEGRWRQVTVPPFCERLIGFSVPQDETILVVSYEGMHLIQLAEPVTVETDEDFAEYDCYDPDTGIANYLGKVWMIIGLYPGTPMLQSPCGEELHLDSKAVRIAVMRGGNELWTSSFVNFSGDWAAATFSSDGKFVVLGCPYDFDFRVWRRD